LRKRIESQKVKKKENCSKQRKPRQGRKLMLAGSTEQLKEHQGCGLRGNDVKKNQGLKSRGKGFGKWS